MNALREQLTAKKTPPHLGDLLTAKKTEAEKNSASCHEAMHTVSFVEFRPAARTRVGFPMAQLCHYTLEPHPDGNRDAAPERLTLAFSTADVVVSGARLAGLVTLLAEHKLEWVAAVDARYANADERAWVGEIAVGHFGKSGSAAG